MVKFLYQLILSLPFIVDFSCVKYCLIDSIPGQHLLGNKLNLNYFPQILGYF